MNREIHYLYGGNGLAAIYVKTAGKDTLFAAVTDRQNSLTAVMDVATRKIEKFSYKPWGMRRNPANWSENVVTDQPARFARGYCMHEHLPQLGLINMGGRIFNERINQFLCADPYRQAPESWLNCNRFGYCMNNPVMYTDPDGEWALVDDGLAMLIGGLANALGQLFGGNVENFGQFMAYFGVGAVGAEVSLYATPVVGGMVVGGGNAALNGVFSGNGVSLQNVGMSMIVGGITSYMGGQISGMVSKATSSLMENVVSPALRYMSPQAIGGAVSGFVVDFAFSWGSGADLKTALKEGGKGAMFGFTTGLFHGLHETRKFSKEHDVNPWTGKPNNPSDRLTPQDISEAFGLTGTLERIERGETLPHRNDGSVFHNRDNTLPIHEDGYYHEYVHPIEGQRFPGAHRIIKGCNGEIYYSPDHYDTFIRIR